MNRSASIRQFVKASGPCLVGTICAAFGATSREERQRIYWAVSIMCRDGILKKSGRGHRLKYRYLREPKIVLKMAPEVMRARRKEQEAARRRLKGIPPREEFLAKVRQEAAERQAARKTVAKPNPAAPTPKPPKARAPKPVSRSIVLQPKAPCVTQVAPPKPRFETSEEWMARTGRKPEVLPAPLALKPWESLPKQRSRAA
jgi:hypothetical protein